MCDRLAYVSQAVKFGAGGRTGGQWASEQRLSLTLSPYLLGNINCSSHAQGFVVFAV